MLGSRTVEVFSVSPLMYLYTMPLSNVAYKSGASPAWYKNWKNVYDIVEMLMKLKI
jgi:hypothetical protein